MLMNNGSVKVIELSKQYGVTDETIRRDLRALAEKWDIKMVYGGAYIDTPHKATRSIKELAQNAKRQENRAAKQLIAQKAAALVEDDDTIALNNGTTVEYIVDYLGDKRVNIVTPNIHVAARAALLPNADVYIPGGKVRSSSGMVMGLDSISFIKSFVIDKCFFGISAICMQHGIMHPVFEEIESNVALVDVSTRTYVVTDSSKIDTTALFNMLPLDKVDSIIVDDDFPDDYRDYMALIDIDVI